MHVDAEVCVDVDGDGLNPQLTNTHLVPDASVVHQSWHMISAKHRGGGASSYIPSQTPHSFAMKNGACAILALAGWASPVQARSEVTPVQKVIELMNGMLAKGEKEKHEEQVQFAAYKQFCDDTAVEKKRAISEAAEQFEEKAGIAMYTSDAARLPKEVAAHDGKAKQDKKGSGAQTGNVGEYLDSIPVRLRAAAAWASISDLRWVLGAAGLDPSGSRPAFADR